jgi:hypothetical protein
MRIRSINYYAAAALMVFAATAHAQTLQFDAKVGPDGKVELVPRTADLKIGAQTSPSPELAPYTENASPAPTNAYMWANDQGEIKGIFTSKAEALKQDLATGDTVKAVAVAPEFAGLIKPAEDYLKGVAQEAARQLMQYAKDTACAMDPRPDSITPTVQVSFSALAGGSLSVSATWTTANLCKAP